MPKPHWAVVPLNSIDTNSVPDAGDNTVTVRSASAFAAAVEVFHASFPFNALVSIVPAVLFVESATMRDGCDGTVRPVYVSVFLAVPASLRPSHRRVSRQRRPPLPYIQS